MPKPHPKYEKCPTCQKKGLYVRRHPNGAIECCKYCTYFKREAAVNIDRPGLKLKIHILEIEGGP